MQGDQHLTGAGLCQIQLLDNQGLGELLEYGGTNLHLLLLISDNQRSTWHAI
jgi:hypothetical protein